MRIYTLVIYIILSLILGVILNRLEREKKNNFFDYIIISNIYVLVLAGVFVNHSSNMFLVVLFQVIGNIFYMVYIKERAFVVNNSYNMFKYFLNVITSYFLNILFINKVDSVFLSLDQVKLVIWLLVMWYLYILLKDQVDVKKINNNNKMEFYENKEYIVMQYAKYKNKYYNNVKSKYKELVPVIYSIMIYENYNRTRIMRRFDELKCKYFSLGGKFGIMQVSSNKYIDDIGSIKLVINKLERLYSKNNDVLKIITLYYKNKNQGVLSIYREICSFDNK